MYYDFANVIYPDNYDEIVVEQYFHSPMFLIYSKNKGIKDTYFIPTFEDELNEDSSSENCVENKFFLKYHLVKGYTLTIP